MSDSVDGWNDRVCSVDILRVDISLRHNFLPGIPGGGWQDDIEIEQCASYRNRNGGHLRKKVAKCLSNVQGTIAGKTPDKTQEKLSGDEVFDLIVFEWEIGVLVVVFENRMASTLNEGKQGVECSGVSELHNMIEILRSL